MADDRIRILAPRASAQRLGTDLTRRRLLGLGATGLAGLVVGPGLLAACGGDDGDGSAGGTSGGGGGGGNGSLNLFTWAEYHSQDLLDAFGNVTVTSTTRTRTPIAKLQAAGGTSGFDMIVPTGAYIPQMADGRAHRRRSTRTASRTSATSTRSTSGRSGIRATTTRSRKDWGSTGWIYDNSVLTTPLATWQDFIDAALGPASGQTSVLGQRPATSAGIYFWANGITWTTDGPGRSRRVRGVHRRRVRLAPEGVRLLPGHQPHVGELRPVAGLERRRPPGPACPSTIPSATRGAWAHRRPSSGWTTARS